MRLPFQNQKRRVIPRWRSVDDSVALSEAAPTESAEFLVPESKSLVESRREWEIAPGPGTGGDLISVAITSGNRESVRDVAKALLEGDEPLPDLLRATARSILGEQENRGLFASPDEAVASPPKRNGPRAAIVRRARRALRLYDRNPYVWLELARQHTILGSLKKARRELAVARHLATNDRLVLRSTARFHLHNHDADAAAWLLGSAESLRSDPWLLAAEIAAVQASGRTSRHIKLARWILDRETPSRQTAELAAAVATVEMSEGGNKKARRLFERVLQAPTENSFSQLVWAQHEEGLSAFDLEQVGPIEQNFEGPAMEAYFSSDWKGALRLAQRWQEQEPFSGRPAALGSFLAAMLVPELPTAEEILRIALRANADDPLLWNNLAFVHAEQGRLDEAMRDLTRGMSVDLKGDSAVALLATSGLISFKKGQAEEGTGRYLEAINLAVAKRDPTSAALAGIMVARELKSLGDDSLARSFRESGQGVHSLSARDRHLVNAVAEAALGFTFE